MVLSPLDATSMHGLRCQCIWELTTTRSLLLRDLLAVGARLSLCLRCILSGGRESVRFTSGILNRTLRALLIVTPGPDSQILEVF